MILWYAQACRIRPLQIHNNFRNRLAIPNKHRIFPLGSKEAFCSNSLTISNYRCKRKFSKCQAHADFIVCTGSVIRHLANQHNFWNRSAFLKKHQIPSRSSKEPFSGNSVKICDCRAFSLFKTLPGYQAFRHSEKKKHLKHASRPNSSTKS